MNQQSLVHRDVRTSRGVVRLWSRPGAFEAERPMVVGVTGMFAGPNDLARLPDVLGLLGDACLVRLPDLANALAPACSVEDLAAAIGEAVTAACAGRPVVMFGVSIGAVVAMAVRAPQVKRVVAVEPTLATGRAWPPLAPLREHVKSLIPGAAGRAVIRALFGVGEEGLEAPRDHTPWIGRTATPVDVMLGEPAYAAAGAFPSLVGPPERALLAARPGVRLHAVAGAGHNVQGQAPRAVREVLLEACRRASAVPQFDAASLDEPLLEAAPLTARRLLHWGPGGAVFARAWLAANPKGEAVVLGEAAAAAPPESDFDALALAEAPPAELLERLAGALAPGGLAVVRWTRPGDPEAAVAAAFARAGLALMEPAAGVDVGVRRARKQAPGAAVHLPLEVNFVAFAPLLMDIRTRLPVRGLRSDPALAVSYQIPPWSIPRGPPDRPKVVVLQRPAEVRPGPWLPLLAQAIHEGWITVLEYDDDPRLVAEVQGRTHAEADMLRFGYAHAVQTTTPPLLDAFRPYNPEVRMFPNTAFDLLPFPEGPAPRRVFYGAVLRGDFGIAVARALAPAIERFPETEFVVVGDRAVFDALPAPVKRFHPFMTYEAYLALMASCAVSLSPIPALPMRETKSDAKFLDAGRAGVLTIASPTVYDRVIEHGVNGLLAREMGDWAPLLIRALADEPWRRTLARRAWTQVREGRMFADQVAERRDWYHDLWGRRAELNAALIARTPGLREAVAALARDGARDGG